MTERSESKRRLNGSGNANGQTKKTIDEWASAINASWRKQVPAIVETGRLLTAAKKALGHGRWGNMVGEPPLVQGHLDFDLRVAEMLMRIAKNPVLSNPKNFSDLPPKYTTLYQLTALPDDQLQGMIADGKIHPGLRGAEAKRLRSGHMLVDEFAKIIHALCYFLHGGGEKLDRVMLDRLDFEFNKHLGAQFDMPEDCKNWLLPRLSAWFDQMQERWSAIRIDSDKVVRDGKITSREPREIADPEPQVEVVRDRPQDFTFGAEHEWADWPIDAKLPEGCAHNKKDHTVANSNGIANDPTGRHYKFGGEINTRPTDTISEQVQVMRDLLRAIPAAKVNYRSSLHVHIGVPGLREDLYALKQVQQYIHLHMPKVFDVIARLPRPSAQDYTGAALAGATQRWKRCLVSHRTLLTPKRLAHQLEASTCDEFFRREVPSKDGRPLWHLQARACVNLRQLLDTGTIEFRHFPGTTDPAAFEACLQWCERFLRAAMENAPIEPLFAWARGQSFPAFPPYDHEIDVRFRATAHDGSVPRDEIAANIKAIEDGTFSPALDSGIERGDRVCDPMQESADA
jgi:hypothetical protein